MSIISDIFKILGKVSDNTQGRIERLKNERDKLILEREELYNDEFSIKAHDRIVAINTRIDYIDGVLRNKASD